MLSAQVLGVSYYFQIVFRITFHLSRISFFSLILFLVFPVSAKQVDAPANNLSASADKQGPLKAYHANVLEIVSNLPISGEDIDIGEQLIFLYTLLEKGIIPDKVIDEILVRINHNCKDGNGATLNSNSSTFEIFVPWLKTLQELARINSSLGAYRPIPEEQELVITEKKATLKNKCLAKKLSPKHGKKGRRKSLARNKSRNTPKISRRYSNYSKFVSTGNKKRRPDFLKNIKDLGEICLPTEINVGKRGEYQTYFNRQVQKICYKTFFLNAELMLEQGKNFPESFFNFIKNHFINITRSSNISYLIHFMGLLNKTINSPTAIPLSPEPISASNSAKPAGDLANNTLGNLSSNSNSSRNPSSSNYKTTLFFDLSELITNEYIKNKLPLHPAVLRRIHISTQLTDYAQLSNFSKQNSQKIIFRELANLVHAITDKVKTNWGRDIDESDLHTSVEELIRFYKTNKIDLNLPQTQSMLLVLGRTLSNRKLYTSGEKILRLALSVAESDANSREKDPQTGKLILSEKYYENIFFLLWNKIAQEKYDESNNIINEFKLNESYRQLPLQLLFWVAYTHIQLKNRELAYSYFHYLIQKYPVTYHAIMASKILADEKFPVVNYSPDTEKMETGSKSYTPSERQFNHQLFQQLALLNENSSKFGPDYKINKKSLPLPFKQMIKRLQIWSKLNNSFFILHEINYAQKIIRELNEPRPVVDNIKNRPTTRSSTTSKTKSASIVEDETATDLDVESAADPISDPTTESAADSAAKVTKSLTKVNKSSLNQIESSKMTLLVATLLSQLGHYQLCFRFLNSSLSNDLILPNKFLLHLLFPIPYERPLKQASKATDIDPIVFLSLIKQESAFNANAISVAGARGLMQLMPGTARLIKRKISPQQLSNPLINIQIGTTLVKKLVRRYNGNLVYVLSAYNAGERNCDRWINNIFNRNNTSLLHTIESIPISETQKYVQSIIRNIFFYKYLNSYTTRVIPTNGNSSNNIDNSDINQIFDVVITNLQK